MGCWLKHKTRDCLGSRGFLKILKLSLNQVFVPTTAKGREQRCQMAIQPFTGAVVCICLVNVVFIFTDGDKITSSGDLSKNFPACRI